MDYGHIVISTSKTSLGSRVIRFITSSNWSHSFIMMPELLGQDLAMEAEATGVSMCSFDKHYRLNPAQKFRIYRFRADPARKDMAIIECLQYLETGYGFLEMPWFIWRGLNKLFGRDIRAKDNWSQDGTLCAELVAQYISLSGFAYFFSGFGCGSVSAQDIFELCEAHPETFELIEFKE